MNGTSTEYLLLLTAVTAGVTILLRALPFLFFGTGKRPPALVLSIGAVLSPAAIAMLVVYCFAGYASERPPAEHMFGLAEIAAGAVVVALQIWKRNPLLSILAGTVVYMTLVHTVVPTREHETAIRENVPAEADSRIPGVEQPGRNGDVPIQRRELPGPDEDGRIRRTEGQSGPKADLSSPGNAGSEQAPPTQ